MKYEPFGAIIRCLVEALLNKVDALLWTTQIELDGLKKKTLLGRLGSGDESRRSRERSK